MFSSLRPYYSTCALSLFIKDRSQLENHNAQHVSTLLVIWLCAALGLEVSVTHWVAPIDGMRASVLEPDAPGVSIQGPLPTSCVTLGKLHNRSNVSLIWKLKMLILRLLGKSNEIMHIKCKA